MLLVSEKAMYNRRPPERNMAKKTRQILAYMEASISGYIALDGVLADLNILRHLNFSASRSSYKNSLSQLVIDPSPYSRERFEGYWS